MPDFPRPAHARHVTLDDIASALRADPAVGAVQIETAGAAADRPVGGVTFDSRAVVVGDLYAALPGANVHGARFAAAAAAQGAVAVLTDDAGLALVREAGVDLPALVVASPRAALGPAAGACYADPQRRADLALVGITGTNGKTTTAFVLDAALRRLGRTTGLIGTVETRVAGERIKSERTTPEASDLHGLLATMVERGVDTCTMEVSSHAMVLHRVGGVVFDVVAFTNLSQDHLDYHPTMADYFAAKASLFDPARARRGVVVVDDEWGGRLAAETSLPVVTVSSDPQATDVDWRIERRDAASRDFVLHRRDGAPLPVTSPLPGDFNQVNTAVAVAVLVELGVDAARAAEAVATDPGVPGRMERVDAGPEGPLAVVDFAHTPDAVRMAIAALRPQVSGRLVAVIGAGGDRDPGKRPHMGAAAAEAADLVVVTDDNPRSEDPATIRAAVLAGVPAERRDRVVEVAGRSAALVRAVEGLGPDDAVVVLGKGHETGQVVAGAVHPFDDREALAAALRGDEHADPAADHAGATPATDPTGDVR